MRIDFEDDDLRRLFTEPSFRLPRFGPDLARQYRKKVNFLVNATDERDIRGWKSLHLEKLEGDLAGQHSIRLNRQWRLLLRFERDDAGQLIVIISIDDYH